MVEPDTVHQRIEGVHGGQRVRGDYHDGHLFLLRLVGVSTTSKIVVHLEPSTEHGIAPVPIRRPAQLPGADLELPFAQLSDGRLEHLIRVGQHTDRVTLRTVDLEAPLDREFEWTDLGEALAGDYYYLRVDQIDGARAWSSPWWVGSASPTEDAPPRIVAVPDGAPLR